MVQIHKTKSSVIVDIIYGEKQKNKYKFSSFNENGLYSSQYGSE